MGYGCSGFIHPIYLLVDEDWREPFDSTTVYAADSGNGILMTRDGGENWEFMNQGLGNLYVLCLAKDSRHLCAGTEAGLWVYDLISPIEERPESSVLNLRVRVSRVGRERVIIHYFIPSRMGLEISLFDTKGALIERVFKEVKKGWHSQEIGISSSGIYFIQIRGGSEKKVEKVIVLD